MEGPMRIVSADFSLGELSPEFAGRVDSEAFHKGVQEMTNAEPYGLGGFHRSPGTMNVGGTLSNTEAFLVPWMVTADISFIVEFTDRHIRLLAADPASKYSSMTPVKSGADDIDITHLDGNVTALVDAYSLAHAKQLDWAQSNTEMVFAHKSYPLFMIRYISGGTVTNGVRSSIVFEYKIAPISGTTARASSTSKSWPARDIYSQVASWMSNAVTYPVSGSINQNTLVSAVMNDGLLTLNASSKGNVSTANGSAVIYASSTFDVNESMVGMSVTGTGIGASAKVLSYDSGTESLTLDVVSTATAPAIEVTIAGSFNVVKDSLIPYAGSIEMDLVPCNSSTRYPGTVAFFNNRLVLSGSASEPNVVYASRPGDHFDFSLVETLEYDVTEEVTTSSAIVYEYKCKILNRNTLKFVSSMSTSTFGIKCTTSSGSKILTATGSLMQDYMIGYSVSGTGIGASAKVVSFDNTAHTVTLDVNCTANGASYATISAPISAGPAWHSGMGGWKVTKGFVMDGGMYYSTFSIPEGTEITAVASENNVTFKPKLPSNLFGDILPISGFDCIVRFEQYSSGAPEYVTVTNTTQQIGADNAMKVVLNTAENESVIWMEAQGDLIIGTKTSEWVISAQSDPTNVSAAVISRHGSAKLKPCKIGGSLVFIQGSGRIVKEFGEAGSRTVNELSNHLFTGTNKNIVDFDYTQSPEEAMYFVLADGSMVKCLMNAATNTMSWTVRRPRTGDKYESVSIISTPFGDMVYCSVLRSLPSPAKRYIEVIALNDDSSISEQCYSGSCYYGESVSPATGVSGLTRLADQVVSIRGYRDTLGYADISCQVQSNGSLTFVDANSSQVAFNKYIIGLPETMRVVLQRNETADTEGLSKAMTQILMRLYKASPFRLRYKDDVVYGDYPSSSIDCDKGPTMYSPNASFSGIYKTTFGGPWDYDQRIIVECTAAGPVGVLSVICDMLIETGG